MARKSSTKTTENPTDQITAALDTPVNLEWSATAQKLSIPVPELQERFAAKLNDSTVFAWDNLPVEHESLVEAIARDLESEASVRPLNPQEAPHLPPPAPENKPTPVLEIPILEEEPAEEPPFGCRSGTTPKKKRKSTGLTKQRKGSVQKTVEDTVTLEEGIHTTELNLATQEGIQDGGQIATTYLVAKQVTENKIRKEAAKRRVAKTVEKTAKQKDFDPLATLQRHGLNPTTDDLKELNELVTPAMETVGNATGEILSNSWINGLQIDCSDLTSLMSDAWND